jgi:hypothetical protein
MMSRTMTARTTATMARMTGKDDNNGKEDDSKDGSNNSKNNR